MIEAMRITPVSPVLPIRPHQPIKREDPPKPEKKKEGAGTQSVVDDVRRKLLLN